MTDETMGSMMTQDHAAKDTVLTLWDGPDGLHLVCAAGKPASLVGGDRRAEGDHVLFLRAVQPLVEILAVGQGRRSANVRHTATAVGVRLRVDRVVESAGLLGRKISVDQIDATTGLRVRVVLLVKDRSVRAWTEVQNEGALPVVLQAVSSLAVSSPTGGHGSLSEVVSIEGWSDWLGESRWSRGPLDTNEGLVRLDLAAHQQQDARGSRVISSAGTWSSGARLPAGVLERPGGGTALAWQVEHNGAWRVELAERIDAEGSPTLVLVLLGPTDSDHSWHRRLIPGERFTTVPVALASGATGWQSAVAAMTEHRRALRGVAEASPWVVFNDYMNTLMGDPTTAKLLPLIDAAADVGAEVFCIDAGWYDDSGDWWDSVGSWEPSTRRFPDGGLKAVVAHIRERGMVPGLWLEPEVVGVRSPIADDLPREAFLQRDGQRIVEQDRYFLDLRHEASRKRLDSVVDRLVDEFAIGYFKLDYNVTPGPGTDLYADSLGDGLLQHNRAHLAWLDGVRERHPLLVLENCASGGMRSDAALLSRTHLQSTSDQQNPLLYPPIAAGALMSILPEQAANWAYPQPGMSDEEIVFTLCTGLAGRFYLSGHLDGMTAHQLALVRSAVRLAQRRRTQVIRSTPTWPLGLPLWNDTWVASGLQTQDDTLVTVWFRGGEDREAVLHLPAGAIALAFPETGPDHGLVSDEGWTVTRRGDGSVQIRSEIGAPQARVLRITHDSPA